MKQLTVQLLTTGNEIMSGDVIDSNSAMIAQQLKNIGVEVKRKTSVSDDLHDLVNEIQYITQQSDILIINGGLGPTVDDLTAQALSLATNCELDYHPQALDHLFNWCKQRNYPLNEPNKKQAFLPVGCEIIPNSIGSAVGFSLTLNDCKIYCTPGVPSELKRMMEISITNDIKQQLPDHLLMDVTRFQLFGIGESTLQLMINEQFTNWPECIELGFRASMPLLELKLTTRTPDALILKKQWLPKLTDYLGSHIVGINNCTLPKTVIDILSEQQKKICLAESCTGGLIASQLTAISGSSAVFEAGFVTYSNQIKHEIINVNQTTLSQYGAVSEQVVLEMLTGALNKSHADVGIAVSGIAGPTGGSENKPVGTVWIAWGTIEQPKTCCLFLPGNRHYIQQFTAAAALDLIRRDLLSLTDTPHYIKHRSFKMAQK